MKRIFFFFFISMMTMIAQAADTPARVFGKLTNLPGVESTYVGPAALRFALGSAKSIQGIPAGVKDLKSVEIIDCSNKESETQIRNFVRKFIKERKFDVLVENASEGERTVIYGVVPDTSSSTMKNILIEISEEGEYVLIYLEGTINLSELTSDKN